LSKNKSTATNKPKQNAMKNQITNYVRAGYSGLYIVSFEEGRVQAEIKAVADTTGYALYTWSVADGLIDITSGQSVDPDSVDPLVMFDNINKLPEQSIILLMDFHMLLSDPNPLLYRKMKDTLNHAKATQKVIVVLGCQLKLPPELEKEITVMEYELPDRKQLETVLKNIAESAGKPEPAGTDRERLLDAASGLTTIEAENAFALSLVETGSFSPEVVYREKCATIKKNGILEIVESRTTLDDIGGLENLKADLAEKSGLFTQAARDYGLPTPRGMLFCGQPGTGKSLCATATRSIFNIPLLKLEAGRIFGSLVGESERNWRKAFGTAKAIAPCVLWIDEVDGLFSGAESSGRTDGGTTSRVIKAILQDMQFNGEGVFFVFTANDIDNLPDPLIDRLDVWSVELPNHSEREAIWRIHIEKRGRNAKAFNLARLADITDGFSGRQIEQVWLKALTMAFNDGGREPNETDVERAASRFTATSVLMADAIERRRKRLANRATPASAPEKPRAVVKGRKIVS
jgi:AAA+ superfamily predicted ATPase